MITEKPRVLIVDDRAENLLALKAVLESPHYSIEECSSGKDALEEINANDYALVVMDVQMPEMDGFETATLIRSQDKTKNLPIIFLSAFYTDDDSTLRGYDVGAVDYMVKPFSPEKLKKKVEFFVSYSEQVKDDQHRKDIQEIYRIFEHVYDKVIDPVWYVLLNIQMMKRLDSIDRQRVIKILNKNMDNLEHAVHEITQLLVKYKQGLEEEVEHNPTENQLSQETLYQNFNRI